VKSKFLSRRAIGLHIALLVWVAICLAAAWWQVGAAVLGNSLSYLYAVEWPAFAVLGVFGWYALLNSEKITEDQEQERREFEEKKRREAQLARQVETEEDPALVAYNDHLAEIASRPKKRLWGH
jgi:DNA-binding transcriptional regulator of glucitol operon